MGATSEGLGENVYSGLIIQCRRVQRGVCGACSVFVLEQVDRLGRYSKCAISTPSILALPCCMYVCIVLTTSLPPQSRHLSTDKSHTKLLS